MRAPGLQMGFMQILSAGPAPDPEYLGGAIGTSFLTPQQGAFRAQRKKYGTIDDPDAGGYHLNEINWDKDSGTTEVSPLEANGTGWYA
jgi:hypothetical protein